MAGGSADGGAGSVPEVQVSNEAISHTSPLQPATGRCAIDSCAADLRKSCRLRGARACKGCAVVIKKLDNLSCIQQHLAAASICGDQLIWLCISADD